MNARDSVNINKLKVELLFIKKALAGISRDDFLHDEILQHAISMSLITIGECANHLSDGFKDTHPEIEWVQIIAVRNIAAHGYWQLDMAQIWQAIEEDIPILWEFCNRF